MKLNGQYQTCPSDATSTPTPEEIHGFETGNPCWRGWLSTVDLLVLASLDQMLLILKKLHSFTKRAIFIRRSTVLSLLKQCSLVLGYSVEYLKCGVGSGLINNFHIVLKRLTREKRSSLFVRIVICEEKVLCENGFLWEIRLLKVEFF
jgi:hypothetical protein